MNWNLTAVDSASTRSTRLDPGLDLEADLVLLEAVQDLEAERKTDPDLARRSVVQDLDPSPGQSPVQNLALEASPARKTKMIKRTHPYKNKLALVQIKISSLFFLTSKFVLSVYIPSFIYNHIHILSILYPNFLLNQLLECSINPLIQLLVKPPTKRI